MEVATACRSALFLSLSALILSSCATARLEQSASYFTGSAVSEGNLAIGPIVQVGGDRIQRNQANILRNELRGAIGKKRDYIPVSILSGSDLISARGGTAESAVSSSVKNSAKSKGYRFLLVAELCGNDIHFDTGQSCDEETETIYDKCGNAIGERVVHITYTTTSRTIRNVVVRFKILDLQLGRTVWVNRGQTSNSSSNGAESCVCYPIAPPHPPAPRIDASMRPLAKAAARKLPRFK